MLSQPTTQPYSIAGSGSPPKSPEAGLQLLLGDAWATFILINAVRKRAIIRAFGVSAEDANVITVIGLALIGGSIHQTGRRLLGNTRPSRADSVLAAGTARALLGSLTGPAVDEMPGLGGLIALALVTHAARPTVTRSVHALRSEWHRFAVGFHGRYGRR